MGSGSVYVASSRHHVVRKIRPDGMLTTVAGTGVAGLSGDGGLATETQLWEPRDVAVDSSSNIYIAEGRFGRVRIRRVLSDGVIETYLSAGAGSPDGTSRTQATVPLCCSRITIEADAEGKLYWFERASIRRVADDDTLETVLSTDRESGVFASSLFAVDPVGEIYLFARDQVARFSAESGFVVVAGVGLGAARGDGGPALEARIDSIQGVAVGPGGEVYFADRGFRRVRAVMPDGTVQRVAGTGEVGPPGDGGPAGEATLFNPVDVAVDSDGNLYIAEGRKIRKVDPAGVITTFAGTGARTCQQPACGDGGPAVDADVPNPQQVAVDSQGNVYVLHDESRIRKITRDGIIETLDVNPSPDRATLHAMAVDSEDNLIVSASFGRIWRVSPEGAVGPPSGAEGFLGQIEALARDGAGNTYSVGPHSCASTAIRRLTSDGVLNTIAGGVLFPQCFGFMGDGGPAGDAVFGSIRGLALDSKGNLYIADGGNRRVRRINAADQCAVVVRPQIAVNGVLHGASYRGAGLVPGLIFSVFGKGLGPDELVGARLGEDGRLATELGGTRVLIDGAPSPMIFSLANQISGIVPYSTVGEGDLLDFRQSVLEVEYEGVRSEPVQIGVSESSPGIFTQNSSGSGLGAVLNQDGSVNGPLNPAAPGSVIVLFATGEGVTEPRGVDGSIAAPPLPKPVLPVTVTMGALTRGEAGVGAEVLYAGAAPGLVLGVLQVNVRVPETLSRLGAVDVELQVGTSKSPRVQVIIGE